MKLQTAEVTRVERGLTRSGRSRKVLTTCSVQRNVVKGSQLPSHVAPELSHVASQRFMITPGLAEMLNDDVGRVYAV